MLRLFDDVQDADFLLAVLRDGEESAGRRAAAARRLLTMGPEEEAAALAALADADPGARRAVLEAMGDLGPRPRWTAAVIPMLYWDPDEAVREAAARALARFAAEGDEAAAEAVRAARANPDPGIRRVVLEAMIPIGPGGDRTDAAARMMRHDPDETVRAKAAEVLVAFASWRDEKAIQALQAALEDPNPMVRFPAAQGIAAWEAPRADLFLELRLGACALLIREHPDPAARIRAANRMAGILLDLSYRERERRFREEAVPLLARMLREDPAPEVRKRVAMLLQAVTPRRAVRPALDALVAAAREDPDPKVRMASLHTIAILAEGEWTRRSGFRPAPRWAVRTAWEILPAAAREDPDPEVRAFVVEAIAFPARWEMARPGEFGPAFRWAVGMAREVLPAVAREDPDPEVRATAAWALAELEGRP